METDTADRERQRQQHIVDGQGQSVRRGVGALKSGLVDALSPSFAMIGIVVSVRVMVGVEGGSRGT